LERQDLSRMYLAHHELESVVIIIVVVVVIIIIIVIIIINDVNVVQEYWLPINALTAIMFPIIAFFEITRLQGFARTGTVSHPFSSACIALFSCASLV